MALLRFILTIPLLAALIAFAVANGQSAPLVWSPFHPALELPFYLPVLVAVAAGFVIGMIVTWFSFGHLRQDRRRQKKTIRELEKHIETLTEKVEDAACISYEDEGKARENGYSDGHDIGIGIGIEKRKGL